MHSVQHAFIACTPPTPEAPTPILSSSTPPLCHTHTPPAPSQEQAELKEAGYDAEVVAEARRVALDEIRSTMAKLPPMSWVDPNVSALRSHLVVQCSQQLQTLQDGCAVCEYTTCSTAHIRIFLPVSWSHKWSHTGYFGTAQRLALDQKPLQSCVRVLVASVEGVVVRCDVL